jgi:hypothetical protein
MSGGFPASMDDDGVRYPFSLRKGGLSLHPWDVSFVCITGVTSGSRLMVRPPVVALARADVVSSSIPCLTVADVRSTITMRAGES